MIKIIKEEVIVEIPKIFCDVCDKVLDAKSIHFEVIPCIVKKDDQVIHPGIKGFVVCSVECLQNPALGLLLNTKIIPELSDYTKGMIDKYGNKNYH